MNVSILPRIRWHTCSPAIVVAALCAVMVAAVAQTPAPTPTLAQQRDAFRAAYAAAQNGQDWHALAQGLQDYPLYPYLEAAALRHDIKTATPAQIDAYLQRYDGMFPADDLRNEVL
jgi:soluble lytic murein transglycosylase